MEIFKRSSCEALRKAIKHRSRISFEIISSCGPWIDKFDDILLNSSADTDPLARPEATVSVKEIKSSTKITI